MKIEHASSSFRVCARYTMAQSINALFPPYAFQKVPSRECVYNEYFLPVIKRSILLFFLGGESNDPGIS
jgi:hypothetical protein